MFGNSQFKSQRKDGFEYLRVSGEKESVNSLVLLHGMFGGLSNYDAIIELTGEHEIFVPAIPIHHLENLSIRQLTNWLHSFMDAMNLETPILLGNSMGGHLALDYAIQHPQNISALVLTGSSGLQEKNFGSTFPRRNDREYVRKQAAQTFYKDLVDDALLDDIMKVINDPAKLRNVLTIARDTHEYTMEEYLPEIYHDVLLIWGKNDEITPPSTAKRFYELMPNAQLRWIDECGHAPMMEHPEKFAMFLDEFLIDLQTKSNQNITTDYEKNYSHL